MAAGVNLQELQVSTLALLYATRLTEAHALNEHV